MGQTNYIIGIDEVGRGPLAGPVAVCAFMTTLDVLTEIGRVKDSKALSAKAREEWFEKMRILQKDGRVKCAVSFVSEKIIDHSGIVPSIQYAVFRSLKKLACDPADCLVLLDGGLQAPKEYSNQKTIIRGDASETAIALASIIAKVQRDRLMTRMATQYPGYGFEKHKGYGTRAHYEALQKLGLSDIHRRSFLGMLLEEVSL